MSIPSTLKTISMADKMSVPQLQQAVKTGSIPAYIAVPLIQERMKDKQEAQMSAAGAQGQQPPVAQQVLAAADAQEAIAGLPMSMPQEYATGGIVAFAEGDLVDDDAEDYNDALAEEEFADFARMMASREAPINKTPNVEAGLRSLPSMKYSDVASGTLQAARPQTKQAAGFDASGHKYDDLATKYAEEIGLPAGLARYMLKKETGGLKNPDAATSRVGAFGPAQLMPATAKELGVDPRNPEQNVMGGVRYLKKMYDRYNGDERLALAAYNAGPGRVDRALKSQQGIAGLPNETMKYIGMADGGIARFAAGDMVTIGDKQYLETDDPDYVMADGVRTKRSFVEQSAQSPWNTQPRGEPISLMPEGLSENLKMGVVKPLAATADVIRYPVNKAMQGINRVAGTNLPATESDTPFYDQYVRGATPTSAVKPETAAAAETSVQSQKQRPYRDEGSQGVGATAGQEHWAGKQEAKEDKTAEVAPVAAKESPWDKLLSQLGKSEEDRAKRADQDRWMGLLTAGLGMMGGTSPNAMVNIGQGAMYGAGQYAQARKQSAAEQAAADKAYATALRYKSLDEYYKEQSEAGKETKAAALEQKRRSEAADDRERFVKQQQAMILAKFPKDPMMWSDAQRAAYDAELQKIYTMPGYITLDRIASPSSYAGFKVVK